METVNINDFNEEKPCEFRGRQYLTRDNGAILRLPKEGCRASKWDNVWTFGKKDENTGYMILAGTIRVHQVVCTAFHGPEPEPHMVVDHIDTNRCNNRPENLRWLTRIENALNNPITRKKIAFLCGGSIEPFLENPAILRDKTLSTDVSWMKTVTKEQAAACKKHMDRWAEEDSKQTSTGGGLGDWVFSDQEITEAANWSGGSSSSYRKLWAQQKAEIEEMNRHEYERQYGLKDSLTPGAKQVKWKTPAEFPSCPQNGERTLQVYLNNLQPGKAFCHTQYGTSSVLEAGYNQQEDAIYVLTKGGNSMKPWALSKITLQNDFFIHSNEGSFFQEDGGQKFFTLAMGREWDGGEVFDEFC